MGDLLKSKIYNYIIYYFNLGKPRAYSILYISGVIIKPKEFILKIEDKRIVVKLINEEV